LDERIKREIWEWVEAFAIAFIIAMVLRTFVVQAFKIPSGSMRPTLVEGDRIFANKFIYRFNDPKRGDIVIFKYPEDPKKDFVKRLVGLPGDIVEIKDGRLVVNGGVLDEPSVFRENRYYNKGEYGEPGRAIEVPEGSYYMLGDNSMNSRDSRYWGFVKRKMILGRAIVIWWPPSRLRMLK